MIRTAIRAAAWLILLGTVTLLGPALSPVRWSGEEIQAENESVAGPLALRSRLFSRLGVDSWHAGGQRGRGVKVAILDSGFRGYRDHLGKALPASISAKSFRIDGDLEARDSQHGILCGEVVHAIAPEADLLFANWEPNSPESFLSAIHWARLLGARVISCSVIMPGWSDGEGGGSVHHRMSQLLGRGDRRSDAVCFASAGNTAKRHWSGTFQAGKDGFHEWQPGIIDNDLAPWGPQDRVAVEVCWPLGGPRFEPVVFDAVTGKPVSSVEPAGVLCPTSTAVRFVPEEGKSYHVRVRKIGGGNGSFHLVALGANLDRSTARGSIPFPADGPSVIAVGAVDQLGRRASYSSCGPNSPCPKPDLVAVVPFPSAWRNKSFSGTSAAAPQAAGIAALYLARHPEWTADQLRNALRDSAADLGPPGHDWETGYGLVRLPRMERPGLPRPPVATAKAAR